MSEDKGGYDDLYGGRPPFQETSDTSEDAADSLLEIALTVRGNVYRKIRDTGINGMTCWEVEQELGLSHQTASARIRELNLKGKLRDSGYRRRTGSGRQATVWVVGNMPEFIPGPHQSLKQQLIEARREIASLRHENSRLKEELDRRGVQATFSFD